MTPLRTETKLYKLVEIGVELATTLVRTHDFAAGAVRRNQTLESAQRVVDASILLLARLPNIEQTREAEERLSQLALAIEQRRVNNHAAHS